MTSEINRLWVKHDEFKIRVDRGTLPKANLDNIRRKIDELEGRMKKREKELAEQENLAFQPPVIVAQALVIPSGLLGYVLPEFSDDTKARKRIEAVAMRAVSEKERALGYHVKDVSKDNCGWDITSLKFDDEHRIVEERHIEVKGRAKGKPTVTVSRNKIIHAINQADKFILAIVLVDGETSEGPYYVKSPFEREPGFAEVCVSLQINKLIGLTK